MVHKKYCNSAFFHGWIFILLVYAISYRFLYKMIDLDFESIWKTLTLILPKDILDPKINVYFQTHFITWCISFYFYRFLSFKIQSVCGTSTWQRGIKISKSTTASGQQCWQHHHTTFTYWQNVHHILNAS